jgi:hypothetical protein
MHHWVVLAARWYCAAAALMRGHRADLWRCAQAMGRAVVLVVLLVLMLMPASAVLFYLRVVLWMVVVARLAMSLSKAVRLRVLVVLLLSKVVLALLVPSPRVSSTF